MARLPDQIDAPITPRQLAALRALSAEAYQPKLLGPNLTAKEAERRIASLKAEIALANPERITGNPAFLSSRSRRPT